MRSSIRLAVACLALIGAAPVSAATRTLAAFAAPKTQTLVYALGNVQSGAIDVLSVLGSRLAVLQLPAQSGQLAGFEYIAPDVRGDVYVGAAYYANFNFTVSIFGYAPGATQSSATLTDGPGLLQAMVIAKNGELAACRTYDARSVIDFFSPGATSPTRSITTSPLEDVFGAAYAADGTLWLVGLASVGDVLTFAYVPPGGTTVTLAFPAPAVRGSSQSALAIDGQGRLVFEARGVLAVYATSGVLERTVALAGRPRSISSIAFSRDYRELYVADPNQELVTYPYPNGGAPLRAFELDASEVAIGAR